MATILVAGGTGKLGKRIIRELVKRQAQVRAIVRNSSKQADTAELKKLGAEIVTLEFSQPAELIAACHGVSCIVSAVAGLHDTIVESQSELLEAALAAGVPRFIPSDFSCDFTSLPAGENRNFDLRKEFHQYLDYAPIAATSIFNGAFTDSLGYNTPFYDTKNKSVAYWGDNPGWQVDFTTMDNTAAYTAAAALDDNTPRYLRIASFQISPNQMVALAEKLKHENFTLKPMGSLADFSAYNKKLRAENPEGEQQLYPGWQNSQYLHSMFSVRNETLDNHRYAGIKWSGAEEVIEKI